MTKDTQGDDGSRSAGAITRRMHIGDSLCIYEERHGGLFGHHHGTDVFVLGGGGRHSHARLIPLLCCFLLSVLLRKRWIDGRLFLDLFSLLVIVFYSLLGPSSGLRSAGGPS